MAKKLSVAQLNGYIKGMFSDELLLHNIEVFGEIQDFSVSNNNTFFTLADGGYLLQCVKFGTNEKIPAGTRVLLSGSVTFFEKGGRVTFNAKTISLYGEGQQHLKLLQLKEQLKSEGLFDGRKQLPSFIKTAAVITSSTGAVIHDIAAVLKKNKSRIDITVIHSRVQGGNADAEIADALTYVGGNNKAFDCVIIARGGGSSADLEIFNSEKLARAVAACAVPVISAVGHEVDYTLCDLCSGTRAGTPSIAAQIICSVNNIMLERLDEAAKRAADAIFNIYSLRQNRLYRLSNKIIKGVELKNLRQQNRVENAAKTMKMNLQNLSVKNYDKAQSAAKNLQSVINALYEAKERVFCDAEKLLQVNSPLKILSKGYAKVVKNGKALNGVTQIARGESVDVYMSDGSFAATVDSVRLNGEKI